MSRCITAHSYFAKEQYPFSLDFLEAVDEIECRILTAPVSAPAQSLMVPAKVLCVPISKQASILLDDLTTGIPPRVHI